MSSIETVPGNMEETVSEEIVEEKRSWLDQAVSRCPKSVLYGIAASSTLLVLGWTVRSVFRSRK